MNYCEMIWSCFASPLENMQVPTIPELQNWLVVDQTNTIQYGSDFDCKHFAATLVLHARAQHWKMGLVHVYGYDINTHEKCHHAINSIVTTEGLVYIEPQKDYVWWYGDHTEIQSGKDYEMRQFGHPGIIHIDRMETIISP